MKRLKNTGKCRDFNLLLEVCSCGVCLFHLCTSTLRQLTRPHVSAEERSFTSGHVTRLLQIRHGISLISTEVKREMNCWSRTLMSFCRSGRVWMMDVSIVLKEGSGKSGRGR